MKQARCRPVLALLLIGLAVRVGFDDNLMLLKDPKAVFEMSAGESGRLVYRALGPVQKKAGTTTMATDGISVAATTTTNHSKELEEEESSSSGVQQHPSYVRTAADATSNRSSLGGTVQEDPRKIKMAAAAAANATSYRKLSSARDLRSAYMQQQQAATNATMTKRQEWSFTSPHEVCPVNITPDGDVSFSSSSSSPWSACPPLYAWRNVIPKTIAKRIWMPSYPGSGSEMTRTIIEAMTGLCAEEIYNGGHCGAPGTVTCKTHFPVIYKPGNPGNPTFQGFFHPSAIMLLRNPAKAIPSFVNQQYERRMTNTAHVIQAPETYWNEQRDDSVAFTTFLKQWKAFVLKWHEAPYRMPHNVTMYLHYEKLTNKRSGPGVLKALAEHVTKLHLGNTTTVNDEEVNCLWNQTIGKGKSGVKRKRTYEPAYNTTHRAMLLEAIRDVRGEILLSHHWRTAPPLVEILDQYLDDVTNNLRIVTTATK